MSPRFVIVCGSGGVGKTSTSAAIGLNAARSGERVLVVTVDPARRLAQALGLDSIGHDASPVHVDGTGSLSVSMLDTKAGWDSLIRRHARDEKSAERVLRNPLYDNITARFVNSHDYIAMEQINELASSDDFDLVVIDTPPSRNALDLLDAPRRMKEFFGGRLLQWLTLPYRSRLLTLASKPFLQIADRLLGAQFLGDIAEFFTLLQSMESGFIARAQAVESLLTSGRVSFVLVTTAEPAAGREAAYMATELGRRRYSLGRIVINRLVTDAGEEDLPARDLVAASAGAGIDHGSALRGMSQAYGHRRTVADRHATGVAELRAIGSPVVLVPETDPSRRGPGDGSVLEGIATALRGA
jgi:anion-transporting  ArsA/GET3 family ATPase